MAQRISGGTVHALPADIRKALAADSKALAKWESLTPLARNEWICWSTSVKKPETRREHIDRIAPHLKEGKRRPCCWIGCIHRKDKSLSSSHKKESQSVVSKFIARLLRRGQVRLVAQIHQ